jgi:hypothetical protein
MWWKMQPTPEPVETGAAEDLAPEGEAADKVGGGTPPGPPNQGSRLPPGPPN